jgi:hypothetical protein
MGARNSPTLGLDAFAGLFLAQTESAGLPVPEHAIHFCLALGLQAGRSAGWALAKAGPASGRSPP